MSNQYALCVDFYKIGTKKNIEQAIIYVVACFNAFQAVLHERAEQTTTRYAGAHRMLYKNSPILLQ